MGKEMKKSVKVFRKCQRTIPVTKETQQPEFCVYWKMCDNSLKFMTSFVAEEQANKFAKAVANIYSLPVE